MSPKYKCFAISDDEQIRFFFPTTFELYLIPTLLSCKMKLAKLEFLNNMSKPEHLEHVEICF